LLIVFTQQKNLNLIWTPTTE